MRLRRLMAVVLVLITTAALGAPSAVFVHRATSSNVSGHITTIDHPAVNGRPSARLVVTPNWNPGCGSGVTVNSPIGVYYNTTSGRWAIFNQWTSVTMPLGAAFNVKVHEPGAPESFLHTTSSTNTSGNSSLTSLTLNNGKAMVVTPNWNAGGTLPGVYVTSPVGMYVDRVGSDPTGRWFVGLQNGSAAMPVGASFNIVAGGATHQTSSSNTSGNSTYPYVAVGDPYSRLFTSTSPYPTWGPGVLNNHPIGVWWDSGRKRWAIFNQDSATMAYGVGFAVQFERGIRSAFVSDRDGSRKIYTASYDGDCVQRVTTGTNEDRTPALNPAGNKIVFQRFGAFGTSRWDIFAVNIDGTGLTRLMTPMDASAYHEFTRAAWSPDGSLIAYVANSDLGPASIAEDGLHVVRADGSGDTLIATELGSNRGSPRFSPDGRRLIYDAYYPTTNYDIYVINVDGTGGRNVTSSTPFEYDPSWSPDGTRMLHAVRPTGGWATIRTMDDSGGSIVDLTPGIARHNRFPFYNASGSRIAWLSYLSTAALNSAELWVMNADGSGQTRLATAVDVEPASSGQFTIRMPPSFAPDNTIFFVSGGEVYRINADGSGLTNLTRTTATERDVDVR